MRTFINIVEGVGPRVGYHITPTNNLKRILTQGIVPRVGPRSRALGEQRPAIYLFTSIAHVEDALMNWMGEEFSENARLSLLKITIPTWMEVTSEAGFEICVHDTIPPECIVVQSHDIGGEETLTEQDEIAPNEAGEITLWHGGKDVQYDYQEVLPHGKGRWEYGPGLYLTNDRSIAQKYAKGGRRLYRVTIRLTGAQVLENTIIPLHDAVLFVERNVKGALKKKVIDDLRESYTRRGERLFADTLVNLCLNWEAIANSKTNILRQFLIDHGIDYAHVDRYGGRTGSEVYVVINPRIITKVEFANADR